MRKSPLLFCLFCLLTMSLLAQQHFYTSERENGFEVTLVSQTEHETVLSFVLKGFEIKEEIVNRQSYQKIELKSAAPIQKGGAPELFICGQSIIVPDQGKPEISIETLESEEISGIRMISSKGVITRDIDPSTVPYQFGKEYTENANFPRTSVSLSDPFIYRDFRGATIRFSPFQYNPLTKKLVVNKRIIVKITTKSAATAVNTIERKKALTKVDEDFSFNYSHMFLNYGQNKYSLPAERGKILIICNSAYISEMIPFKNWKNRSGYRTEIVDIASIGNNSSSIKDYISNYYTNKGLSFVIFVGDGQHITPITSGVGGPSDNAYGYISGNDHYPEVYVGRFSAESAADVAVQVNRTLQYERTPDQSTNWLNRTIGIASDEGPGDDSEYDYTHMRNLQTDLMNYEYLTKYELFDGDQGGLDASGDVNAAMVKNQVNAGAGLINYIGHGSDFSWVTSGFSVTDMSGLTNTKQWPFIWSVACVNGNFQGQTCFAEGWLRARNAGNEPTGAVAALMSTINQSWNSPMAGQDEMIDVLTEQFPSNIKRTFGALSMAGCGKMIEEYTTDGENMADTWTIFGDPSLMVRTDTAKTIVASHPTTLIIGMSQLTINCSNPGAYATLSINDTILASGALVSGTVTLNFASVTNIDTINVVITAYNHIPYEGEVAIIPGNTPFVIHQSHLINDATGNNNGNADAGETIKLSMEVKNWGMQNASNVVATLSAANPSLSFTDNTNSYGNINAGSTANASDAYTFSVSGEVEDQANITINVNASDGTNNWTSSFPITVSAPKLSIGGMSLSEISGNGNGKADPGETISITIVNSNIGHVAYMPTTSTLQSGSTWATVSSGMQDLSTLDPSENANAVFTIQISPTFPAGASLPITNTLGSGYYAISKNFTIKVGQADEDFESNDFTQYTWTFNGTPWTTSTESPYEGSYCSKSGDINDSENSTLTVTMEAGANDSISFYKKVSCEAGSASGSQWDYLEFLIDGNSQGWWDGEQAWSRVVFPVSAGQRTYTWTYHKDEVVSEGSDCAWVDFIVFPPIPSAAACEENNPTSFEVFPNPTQDILSIRISENIVMELKAEIYNTEGKLLISTPLVSEKTQVDLSTLSSGIYYIKVGNSQMSTTRMIVIGD